MGMVLLFAIFAFGYWVGSGPSDKNKQHPEPRDYAAGNKLAVIRRLVGNTDLSPQDRIAAIAEIVGAIQGDYEQPPAADVGSKPAAATPLATTPTPTQGEQLDEQVPSVSNTPVPVSAISLSRSEQLLYFGAFLFVTSVGLFTAFADVSGVIRTMLVALVAVVMYGSGFYLYNSTNRLRTAGEAFVGIGMILLPLIGVAAYGYIFNQQYGAVIWLMTSFVALAVYALTILRLQTTFVAYLMIGGLVSSMLSMVSVIDGPLYMFIWMLTLSGLVVQLLSLYSQSIPPLQTTSTQLSQLFVPAAVSLSFLALAEHGAGQLGVTLLLGAAFYAVQMRLTPRQSQNYLILSHLLSISGVTLVAYSLDSSVTHAVWCLLAGSAVHVLYYLLRGRMLQELAYTALVANIVAIMLSLVDQPRLLLGGLSLLIIHGIVYARTYADEVGVLAAALGWLLVSVVVGQQLLEPSLDLTQQVMASSAAVAVLVAISVYLSRVAVTPVMARSLQQLTIIGLAVVLLAALGTSAWTIFHLGLSWYGLALVARWLSRDHIWTQVAYSAVYLPLGYLALAHLSVSLPSNYATIVVAVSLVVSIIAALLVHRSWHRWMSTITWLALPYAWLYDQLPGVSDTLWFIIISYSVVALCLVLSRAIARGRILRSDNVTIQSLTRTESQAYLVGFVTAVSFVTLAALVGDSSAVAQAGWLGLVLLLILGYGLLVEQSDDYWSLAPLYLQLILFRLLLPIAGQPLIEAVDYQVLIPLVSSLVALLSLLVASSSRADDHPAVVGASLLLFVAPLSVFAFGYSTWPMPLSLMVAAGALLVLRRQLEQPARELLGAVAVIGSSWTLLYHGVDSWIIHTHIYAGLAALYAVLRYRRGEITDSNNYITVALVALTVPVVLEALASGGGYSLLLIAEQAAVFTLGVMLGRTFISRWGLYVAVAAVVFQLRDLGWAMLAVISLFIIGIAIYNSLQHDADSGQE